MIKFRLACDNGHEFEGWFQNGAAFDTQAAGGQVACPVCNSTDVSKAVMAPRFAARAAVPGIADATQRRAMAFFETVRTEIEASAENVGPRFAAEARRIHFQEAKSRPIYGEATLDDAKSLNDDGVPFLVLPRLAKDQN